MDNMKGILAAILFLYSGMSFSKGTTVIVMPPLYGGYADPTMLPASPIAPFLPNMGYPPPSYYGAMMLNRHIQDRQDAMNRQQEYDYQQAMRLRKYLDARDNRPSAFNDGQNTDKTDD